MLKELQIIYGVDNTLTVKYLFNNELKERTYDINKLPDELIALNKRVQKAISEFEVEV